MNAAKARLKRFGQSLAHLGDRQPRGVAGHDGVWRDKGRNFFVERCLPVHALGNRLNDQVAALEQRQVLFVVGRLNQRRVFRHAQRCGFEFFQAFNGLDGDAAFGAFCGRQVKQQHRHPQVGQMGGDLRTHHASAQHGDFFH